MAKVFLDTNFYIEAVYRNPKIFESLSSYILCFSPLSAHIFFYAFKIKVPCERLAVINLEFQTVDLTGKILLNALKGPTSDLEDNIQLHSAAEAECDYFLTNDKKLLSLKFFGKTGIVNAIKDN